MNKHEVSLLLTLASGFDRRKVDELTVEAWHSVPDIKMMAYSDCSRAVIDHQTGPIREQYLTVGIVTDSVRSSLRMLPKQVAEDVRAARGYRLVESDWAESHLLPESIREALKTIRQGEQRAPINPGTVGKADL